MKTRTTAKDVAESIFFLQINKSTDTLCAPVLAKKGAKNYYLEIQEWFLKSYDRVWIFARERGGVMSLTLYNFPQSTCSQKVRMVLWEKGIDFIDRPVDSTKREHLSDWYLKMNPHGVVPTLVHDDAVIIDSSVIIEYLDEVFPNISLTPSNAVGRAHMRKWLRFFEEVPTAAIRIPSFNHYLSKRFDKLTEEEFKEFGKNHPIRSEFYKKMRKEKGFDDSETESALNRLTQTLDFMESGLQKSCGPWLMV